jgi:hypothetical protein
MFRQPFRMRASICVAFIVLLSAVLACPTIRAQYAHTKGEQVVDAQGHEIHLRGINLGNWMVPCWRESSMDLHRNRQDRR